MVEEIKIPDLKEHVKIDFSPVWCSVTSENSQELHEYLYSNLAYRPEGYFFSPKYQNGIWDGYNRLYKPATKKFRVGLLSRVTDLLQKAKCAVEINDFPTNNTKELKTDTYKNAKGEDVKLREYQKEAVLTALSMRIGIIKAPARSGKCFSRDTAVLTDQGLLYPEELFADIEYSNVEEVIFPYKTSVSSIAGNKCTSSGYITKVNKVVRINLKSGLSITCTPSHPLLTFNSSLDYKFCSFETGLKERSYVCVPLDTNLFGNNVDLPPFLDKLVSRKINRKHQIFPTTLSLDLCRFMAYIICEGSTRHKTVSVSNKDIHVVKDLKFLSKKLFNMSLLKLKGDNVDYVIRNADVCNFLIHIGVSPVKSAQKTVPLLIRKAPKSHIREFLKTVFESEGSATGRHIEMTSASEQLINEIQLLLLNFGVRSQRTSGYSYATNSRLKIKRKYYRLTITHVFVKVFEKEIGFLFKKKNNKLLDAASKVSSGMHSSLDVLPFVREYLFRHKKDIMKHIKYSDSYYTEADSITGWSKYASTWSGKLSKKRLQRFLDLVCLNKEVSSEVWKEKNVRLDYFYDEISSIEEINNEQVVYDLEVPEGHNFVANGIINHNTLVTTAIIDNEDEFPVNFFVRSKDLAYQTLKVFEQNFPKDSIGFICDGICEIKDINIVTIQSAYSAYNKEYKEKGLPKEKELTKKAEVRSLIRNVKRVFLDETHHLVAGSSIFIYDHCVHANMKIGLSATPFSDKADSILVEESTGPVIYQISYSELIKAGYLMKPYIYMYKLPKMEIEGAYRAIYNEAVVKNEFLSKLIQGIVVKLNKLGKSVVIQTEFVQHSKDLAKRLGCEFLTGSDSTEKRQRIIQELTDKKILCVVSTLFEEGLDIFSLDYTVNLAGGLSNISTFQRMRSITAHESKTTIGIVDFIHQCKYLKRHSNRRLDLYQSEPEFVVEIRDVSKKIIEEIF